MHHSIHMFPAQQRCGNRAAVVGLAGFVSLFVPALCQAQAPPTYTISTVVGQGPPVGGGKTGDGGAATSATLFGPTSLAIDSKGSWYISDQFNNVIRSVVNGTINEFAGTGAAGFTGDNGPALNAELNIPDSVAFDSKGNLYISDVNNGAIRVVSTTGVISTVAGSQTLGSGDSGDGGLATNARLNKPAGIALDSSNNLYIADSANFKIRMVTASNGIINTIAGSGFPGFSNGNGVPTQAHLNGTRQMTVDPTGALYFADSLNNEVRKIAGGTIQLVAGSATGQAGFSGDEGLATNALLNFPTGVAVDTAGNVYICDSNNGRIRMVTTDGNIHTIAGTGVRGYSGDGGPALSAQFAQPTSITVDANGKLYISDLANNVIRLLTPSGSSGGPGSLPSIATSGGVLSASDFGALTAAAPGSWIEIYGSNLASTTRMWTTSDFTGINAPTSLNRTSVTVGGQAAFVEYISPKQVNAQIPAGVGLGSQPVTVTTAAGTSSAFNVNISLQQPGLYAPAAFRILGQQYVGALFTDLTTYVFPTNAFAGINSRPAKPGDTIVIYGVGFAQVPGNPAGQLPQAANGLTLPIQPKFFFNGTQAQVSYAGLAPGFIGLYQFNVIVPNITVPPGQVAAVAVTFSTNQNGADVPGTQKLYTAISN